MDAVLSAATAALSPATLAAFGPTGAVLLFMAWMLWSYYRGREERQARVNEEMAKSLREDQRELFEQQAAQLDGERAMRAALEARVRALDDLTIRQRRAIFDLYVLARENAHAAVNAQQALVSAGLKEPSALTPPVWPELPKAD